MIIIPPEEHTSNDILTSYEIASLLAQRCSTLSSIDSTLTEEEMEITSSEGKKIKLTASVAIAKAELNAGKCPFLIQRTIYITEEGTPVVEIVNPNLMRRPYLQI